MAANKFSLSKVTYYNTYTEVILFRYRLMAEVICTSDLRIPIVRITCAYQSHSITLFNPERTLIPSEANDLSLLSTGALVRPYT